MEVEQWALIQAYGLEGVGRLGFFSMNFEVSLTLVAGQRKRGKGGQRQEEAEEGRRSEQGRAEGEGEGREGKGGRGKGEGKDRQG